MRVSTSSTTALLIFSAYTAALPQARVDSAAAAFDPCEGPSDLASPSSAPSSSSPLLPCSSGQYSTPSTNPNYQQNSNTVRLISFGQHNTRDPRSLRFQSAVFRSDAGSDAASRKRKAAAHRTSKLQADAAADGRRWAYGSTGNRLALEGQRQPGFATAHLLPQPHAKPETPPRMHWRLIFILSIAIPTFLALTILLLLTQWLFFPHTLDLDSPTTDGYLPIHKRRSRHHARTASDKVGSGEHTELVVDVDVVTGADAGPSARNLTRRSPNPLRAQRIVGWADSSRTPI
ncbi:unnamed protein product [Tilletia controversa]|uniref:Uncharacterized protein n=2 Tax=Tilletia TaxID=13289 RepID=A0A177UXF8_9BASI|nr:hypothetical protein CF336_g5451 [Tilletia laevis]KAE8256696.1 hypothetical protein A4X03_0g5148 [Tilletia caries]CAD6940194.1 unnamed protein product [Tilletia controversa]KAE8196818.1 hypothetical protein CF335_g4763 [Tilletia laevis]CAD6890514.1 unnamed protein product [Tilletia caries]